MSFVIPNIVFVILLAIATGYLTFLTAKGGLTDNRFSGFWEKITKRGKRVVYMLTIILLLLACQEWNLQNDNQLRNQLLKNERDERDSLIAFRIKVGVDSNSEKLYNDISKAFINQRLLLDTVGKRIVDIKDSSHFLNKGLSNLTTQQLLSQRLQEKLNKEEFLTHLRTYRRLETKNIVLQFTFQSKTDYEFAQKHRALDDKITNFTLTTNEILNIPFVLQNKAILTEWLSIRDAVYTLYYTYPISAKDDERSSVIGFVKYDSLKTELIKKGAQKIVTSRDRIKTLIEQLVQNNGVRENEVPPFILK